MEMGIKRLRQNLVDAWFAITLLYTSGDRTGWRKNVLHFAVCFIISLVFNTFLFLFLHHSLKYGDALSGAVAGACAVVATAVLFFSKCVRCFGILFLISCGMRQGRNLLIAAGTGLVVFRNVQNTFANLKVLVRSMECNLGTKSLTIDLTPLSNYIKILHWIASQLKGITDFGLFKFNSSFHIDNKSDSVAFREKLKQAHRALNETAENMLFAVNTASSVCHNVFPFLGTALLFIYTALYLRKYFYSRKFQNTFITGKFIQYDEEQKAEGKPHVLPLTEKEARRYIAIPSPRLSIKEGKVMLKFWFPVLTNLFIWVLFIAVDGLLYWFILVIRKHLEQIEPFHVALVMNVRDYIAGGPVTHKKKDFSFSLDLFERRCLPEPTLLLYQSVVPLAVILVFLLILGLLSAKLTELKLLVSAEFFGENAEERVRYLHAKILRGRSKTKLNDPSRVLKTFMKKTSFWFPIFFRHQKDYSTLSN